MSFHTIFKDYRLVLALAVLAFAVVGCEKADIRTEDQEKDANVTLRFSPYQQEGFTRAASALTNQCSKLSVAVFASDGTKTKNITQKSTDAGFGTVALSLMAGTYRIVAIAHNGQGNASISSTEKATFANNKVTDTFAYYGTLTVGDEPLTEDVQLTRRVAMVRLTMTAVPEGVTRIKFYYTGGSSTYNPTTGYGCVNSKQTEYRDCEDEDGQPVTVYELYTLPHEENDVLKMTISPLDETGAVISEYVLTDIPVTRNKITTWTGDLFGGGGTVSQGGLGITLDTGWDGTLTYNF